MTTLVLPSEAVAWRRGRAIPRNYVLLTCDDPTASILLLLGTEAPTASAGVGGWEITARPRQVGMTTWQGAEPFQLSLPVMLEGFSLLPQRSVEPVLRKLVKVARGDDESPPGVVQIDGIPLPVDEWVIESMEMGDPILRASDGHRIRQPLTLTLREYVPPEYVQLRRKALKGARGKTKIVKTKRGDTPAKMARRYECSWKDLRSLNVGVITKANQKLKEGTKVRVPVSTSKSRKGRRSTRKKAKK